MVLSHPGSLNTPSVVDVVEVRCWVEYCAMTSMVSTKCIKVPRSNFTPSLSSQVDPAPTLKAAMMSGVGDYLNLPEPEWTTRKEHQIILNVGASALADGSKLVRRYDTVPHILSGSTFCK